jgi:anti-anti-sigma regulatory factor
LFGIQVEESGLRIEVGMWGEFDAFSLPTLREVLDEVCAFGGPTVVDLSEITFLDLQSARELVVRSLIQTHQLVFQNPSPGVRASVRALGLEDRTNAWNNLDREEQIFSEA